MKERTNWTNERTLDDGRSQSEEDTAPGLEASTCELASDSQTNPGPQKLKKVVPAEEGSLWSQSQKRQAQWC